MCFMDGPLDGMLTVYYGVKLDLKFFFSMNKDQMTSDLYSVNCPNKGYFHLIGCGLICLAVLLSIHFINYPDKLCTYLQGHLQLHLQTFACACSQLISMVQSVSCTISELFFGRKIQLTFN